MDISVLPSNKSTLLTKTMEINTMDKNNRVHTSAKAQQIHMKFSFTHSYQPLKISDFFHQ